MLTKILTALHLDDPASLKRAIATVLGTLCLLLVNPLLSKVGLPPVSDEVLLGLAGLIATFVLQSGLKSAAEVKVTTPSEADKALGATPVTK